MKITYKVRNYLHLVREKEYEKEKEKKMIHQKIMIKTTRVQTIAIIARKKQKKILRSSKI